MLLVAYLEMFHGFVLLNCYLCDCKISGDSKLSDANNEVVLKTVHKYI